MYEQTQEPAPELYSMLNCFSTTLRVGRRTYFFDIRENKHGEKYLTLTESKQVSLPEDAVKSYRKSKIFLRKQDAKLFLEHLSEALEQLE